MGFLLLALFASVACASSAVYTVRFESFFCDSNNFPASCPSNAHMSPPFVAVHSDNYALWRPGTLASPGLVLLAETGGTSTVQTECDTSLETFQCKAGSSINGIGSTDVADIVIPSTSALVSVASMVAPSPDWFVGVNSFKLHDAGSGWRSSVTVDSAAYTAGSDGGATYTAANMPLTPHVNISMLTTFLVPVPPAYPAKFTFTLVRSSGAAAIFPTVAAMLGALGLILVSF